MPLELLFCADCALTRAPNRWIALWTCSSNRRYPTTQGEFFERAAQPFQKRDAFFAFSALAFGVGVLAWGLEGSVLAQLPIAKGPTKAAELGPRGKL